jgi:lysophospholipase L1-like esterase
MCRFRLVVCLALIGSAVVAAVATAQPAVQPPVSAPSDANAQPAAAAAPRIEWEVKNRFRLFRDERDFQRHVAASRGDGVLAAEDRLAKASGGLGWATDVFRNLCLDAAGRVTEPCTRDGRRESYLAPTEHRITALVADGPANATCAWTFDDGDRAAQKVSEACDQEITLSVRYGLTTKTTVEITLPDQTTQYASAEIAVRDLLIAGLGDSIASGEGNPDRPIKLATDGFCFRRTMAGGSSEYFRPGRAGFHGSRACGSGTEITKVDGEWASYGAGWISAGCHRSLYGYQMRTALELAVEYPHIAVTFVPLACSGASIESGLLAQQSATDVDCRGKSASCSATSPGQIAELGAALALARRSQHERTLDLVLLTIGANDIKFSGLVANVIIERGAERVLFERAGRIASIADAQRSLASELPTNFARLRAALKPLVGGDMARVVYVAYGHPALQSGGIPCPGGRAGFDIHPAFVVDAGRLRQTADFVSDEFFPRLKALALCESGVLCREPATDRMAFVDAHQRAFTDHGYCAHSDADPDFDRECFSATGESFQENPADAAADPLICEREASEFRLYAARARWIRTANDSYFGAMTYPLGLPSLMQPSDLHDAIWGITSALYGGAVHPTAEGHAAMADAALPAVRKVLDLPAPNVP